MSFPPLPVLQSWMQSLLRGETGQNTPPIGDVITSSGRQSAEERLAVYARAYFGRLLECLEAEFPAVRHAAGDEAFRELATGYLRAFPSQSYTLGELGRHWSEFLRQTRPPRAGDEPDFADFLVELAHVERCYSEVFDGPGPEQSPAWNPLQLASVGSEQFAQVLLILWDSVRLLDLQFPCHDYATDVRQKRDPFLPEPTRTFLVVFRRDYIVRRFSVEQWQFELLSELQRGRSVGDALRYAATFVLEKTRTADDVRRSFQHWAAAPLFRQVISPGEIG